MPNPSPQRRRPADQANPLASLLRAAARACDDPDVRLWLQALQRGESAAAAGADIGISGRGLRLLGAIRGEVTPR
jgi:hypothetical protein